MPETANNLDVKARQLWCPAIGVSQVHSTTVTFGEGDYDRSDAPVKGRIAMGIGRHARHIKKIIVKPCAGKLHARFERGLLKTGWRKRQYRVKIYLWCVLKDAFFSRVQVPSG